MSPEGLLGMKPVERSVQTCFLCLSSNPSVEQLLEETGTPSCGSGEHAYLKYIRQQTFT